MIVAEKIFENYPIESLKKSIWPLFEQFSAVQRSPAIGGWALQSTNKSYKDGWTMNFCPYSGPDNQGPRWTPRNEIEKQLLPVQNFILPTEIHSAELDCLFQYLNHMNLNPRKARIIKLSAHSESSWHQDGSSKFYQVRLHIPLITNENCFFENKSGRFHMAADGSAYLVHINQPHRILNAGDTDRYHFVCHVWDTNHISEHHRYSRTNNDTETTHPQN